MDTIYVTLKSTGEIVLIKKVRFNDELHELQFNQQAHVEETDTKNQEQEAPKRKTRRPKKVSSESQV